MELGQRVCFVLARKFRSRFQQGTGVVELTREIVSH